MYDSLDLSTLQSSPLVEIDFESILSERKDLFLSYWDAARAKDSSLPAYDVEMLETDPAVILNEEFSYAETLILQQINDAGKKLRLKDAYGIYLDHIAVTYHRTERRVVLPATGTADAVYESDASYRLRAQLQPEALADMGLTAGGYVYKIRTAFADRIKHVFPINRGEGRVELRLLGLAGNGTVDAVTLADVVAAFRIEEGQQSTDVLTVLSAEVEEVVWDVTLFIKRGPDPATVTALARKNLQALADQLHKVNETQYCEAIAAAAHVGPVVTTRVNSPASDRIGAPEKAYYVTAINVAVSLLT